MAAEILNIVGTPTESIRTQIISAYKLTHAGRVPRLVFVSGNFNIIHPGHQRLIQFASEIGDVLIIGVNHDSMGGVYFPQGVRVAGMRELSLVDYVIPLQERQLLPLISALKPEFVVKGKEHEQGKNEELGSVAEYGGRLVFGSGDQKFSSLDILRKDFENIQYSNISQPDSFLARHGLDRGQLICEIGKTQGLKVIVIGDTIIDEYITCEALGLSQEDPTIVVNPIHRIKFLGGAAIVAAHAAGLGADVEFFSVLGQDPNAQFAIQGLDKAGVKHSLLEDRGRPTTLKQRYRAREKTLLRVNELSQRSIPREISAEIMTRLKTKIKGCNLLVFSDFNYGCLPTPLVNEITELCHKHKVMMVADSQSSSQIGDVSRFKGMKLITPTEREARLGVNDFESGLVVLIDSLMAKASAENVLITLGAEGLLIRGRPSDGNLKLPTLDKLPAFNSAPRDPAGAGDSLLITASMVLASGGNIWMASYLGSLAAAIQVGRVGNTPLTSEELLAELRSAYPNPGVAS